MVRKENLETSEINKNLCQQKSTQGYQETAKKLSISYLSTILALITKEPTFKLQWSVLAVNFEQHFESCVLMMHTAQKSARNQRNSLNTSKNELMEIFRGFRVFEYALWQKTKTRKYWKLTATFLNKKHPLLTATNTRKAINFLSKYNFRFNNKKATFKLQ